MGGAGLWAWLRSGRGGFTGVVREWASVFMGVVREWEGRVYGPGTYLVNGYGEGYIYEL